MRSTAIRHEPLEVPVPPLHPAQQQTASLSREIWERSVGARNTEISSDTHHSINTDDTCDTGDEDQRPAKRRKPRSAPAVTAPLNSNRPAEASVFQAPNLSLPPATNVTENEVRYPFGQYVTLEL